jgi:hypothetical protein
VADDRRPALAVQGAWGAIAEGFAGTHVLTTALRAANELNLTRMDVPFLLGTVFSTDRARAKAHDGACICRASSRYC